MALMYGNVQAAEQQTWQPTIEAGLSKGNCFLPNISFNENTVVKAGVRYAVKYSDESVVDPKVAGTNNYDFSNASTDLVQIVMNNELTPSTRVYDTQISGVSYPQQEVQVSNLVNGKVKPSMQAILLAALCKEGTEYKVGGQKDTTAITAANVKDYFITLRQALRKAGVAGDLVCQVSTEVYACILKVAGADFDAEIKNRLGLSGQVGTWLGFTIFENPMLGDTLKYVDSTGTLQTVDTSKVDLVAYDWETLYCDILISHLAVQNATTFYGIEVVSDVVVGAKVGTPKKSLVKFNA